MQEKSTRNWPAAFSLLLLLSACSSTDKARDEAEKPKPFITKTGIEMVLLPAGEFRMGDADGADDEKPVHRVRIRAFYIDKHEVTQQSYRDLMGKNPCEASREGKADRFYGLDKPVVRVSWPFAVRYCNLRSLREGLKPCYKERGETYECDFAADGYRLPTEAEWEYACRAGTTSRYSCGNNAVVLRESAWLSDNAGGATHPVGQKLPNPWGLVDMHGNAAEWCNDVYSADAYEHSEAQDPRGPAKGAERVIRGGSWRSSAELCRSAARSCETPALADVCFGYEQYGFRCVRRGPDEAKAPKK